MICAFIMFIDCFVIAFGGKGFIDDLDAMAVAFILEVCTLDIAAISIFGSVLK